MSGDKVFIDTNILVYAYDVSAGGKHEAARKLVAGLWISGLGVVSTQVLQEFYVTATRKLPKPIDPKAAQDIVRDLLEWEVVTVDGEMILAAMDLHRSHGLSFWDALIIVAAGKAGCELLMSEDLSSGGSIGGVTLQNPLVNSR
jgi:predicted nucleic acid-binding protein